MSLTPFKRKQILFAVAIGTFIAPLDASVVNIALPSISEYYQVSVATAEWIVMIYLLVISSLLLSYGRMGDLYGYKKIYLSGFAVFTIGSLFSAISPNINLLIAFRAFQALGAGMLMAMGPAIITEITPREERGRALGTTAVAVSAALTAGPVIGGLLTTHFGWPSIFLINLPIGFIGMLWANRVIPHLRGGERQSFDFIGAALLALALTSILFALSYSAKAGWKGPLIWAGFIFGFALLIVFVLL